MPQHNGAPDKCPECGRDMSGGKFDSSLGRGVYQHCPTTRCHGWLPYPRERDNPPDSEPVE